MHAFLFAAICGTIVTCLALLIARRFRNAGRVPGWWPWAQGISLLLIAIALGIGATLLVIGEFSEPGARLRSAVDVFTSSVSVQAIIGLIFGILFGYWIQLLFVPTLMITQSRAQRLYYVWGAMLAVLLMIGVTYPYLGNFLDNLQSVTTPFGKIELIKSNEKAISFDLDARKNQSLIASDPFKFNQTSALTSRISSEQTVMTIMDYNKPDDIYFSFARNFIENILVKYEACVTHAAITFVGLERVRGSTRKVADRLRAVIIDNENAQAQLSSRQFQDFLSLISTELTKFRKIVDEPEKCKELGSDQPFMSLQAVSKKVPYLHVALADLYRFSGNIEGSISILDRAKNLFVENDFFAMRVDNFMHLLLLEWGKRLDLALIKLDATRTLVVSTEKTCREAREESEISEHDRVVLRRFCARVSLFVRLVENSIAYISAMAWIEDPDAKDYVSELIVRQYAESNAKSDLSKELHILFGPDAVIFGKSVTITFLDTLGMTKFAFAGRKAVTRERLNMDERKELRREIQDAIKHFQDALSLLTPLAKTAEKEAQAWPIDIYLIHVEPAEVTYKKEIEKSYFRARRLLDSL